jgi:putative flippase GtrA
VRYSLVSLVSVAVSQSVFAVAFGVLQLDGPVGDVVACGGAVSSFHLNRSWAWGRGGRSRLLRDVVPFWALAFLGWPSPPGRPTWGAAWLAMRPPHTW